MTTYRFRSTSVNRSTGEIRNVTELIDVLGYIEHLRKNERIYGNLGSMLEEELPRMKEDPASFSGLALGVLTSEILKINPTTIFELGMYFWEAYKRNEISREAWSNVFGWVWQSGSSSLLGAVELSQSTVIKMFESADREIMYEATNNCDEPESWASFWEKIPDPVVVYRGMCNKSAIQERGFSWTLSQEEAQNFALRAVHDYREIPIVVETIIQKSAILGAFTFESEIVIDPRIKKLNSKFNFMKGEDLRKFRAKMKRQQKETGSARSFAN